MPTTTTTTDPDRLRADTARAEADKARARADQLEAEVADADAADAAVRQARLDDHDKTAYESYDRAAVDAGVDARYQKLVDAIRADPIVAAWIDWAAERYDRHHEYVERQAFAERWREAHPDEPLTAVASGPLPALTGVEVPSIIASTASAEVVARRDALDATRTSAREHAYTGD